MVSGPENGAQTHFARTTREAVMHISVIGPTDARYLDPANEPKST